MFRTTLIATALTVSALSSTPSHAASGLGGCYNVVISACNALSKSPQDCARSGMDICDTLFSEGQPTSAQPIRMIRDNSVPGGYRFAVSDKLQTQVPHVPHLRDDDNDDSRSSRGGGNDPDGSRSSSTGRADR